MIAVGLPMYAAHHDLFCGGLMDAYSAHLFSGTIGFEFFSPAQLTMGGIVLPIKSLPVHLQANRPHSLQARLLPLPQDVMRDARALMQQIFSLCRQAPTLLDSKQFRQQLRTAVISCVADILADHCEDARIDNHRRWKIVLQAREIINQNTAEPITIESLCLEVGVSRRTLQYCFQEALGINPVAFLRAQRLNGVRRMLKEVHSVTDAATAWGFWHFGHFSQEYKKLFGELPSQTMRRELH